MKSSFRFSQAAFSEPLHQDGKAAHSKLGSEEKHQERGRAKKPQELTFHNRQYPLHRKLWLFPWPPLVQTSRKTRSSLVRDIGVPLSERSRGNLH